LDLKQIKQIIDLMKRSELTEFAVEEEGFKLKIRRGFQGLPFASAVHESSPPAQIPDQSLKSTTQIAQTTPSSASASPNPIEEPGIAFIKSPMVGTFYRSPSPESKPFAEIGSKVTETSAICIIEAMKIMNEIQSEIKGTIVEILIENGQPVEYGQKLFKVKQT
jgi:acetyl-CoA carboxylase biotin carboxyl carrier protein